ncbi:rod shape-determining protein MreC [Pantoea sp. Mhis]|uniref:rod shape-determining protein MreC n=1 Tax=Pantoea sp. Mhis TaxID=2576759 RepID=UPI0013580337|nr:rod shape-determining protein MreC [Pantoea sp. Mhis]MXP56368.1 rod shape-determining protein MreC [Pantoea sp. Mhis]
MKLIFSNRGPSLQLRLLLAVVLAIMTMIVDSHVSYFVRLRNYLDTSVSPLYFLANIPHQLFDNVVEMFVSHQKLENENKALRKELFLKKTDLLMLNQYKKENLYLSSLLGSPLHENEYEIIAKRVPTNINTYTDQIIINKGSINDVYIGQPLINDKGIVGQIVTVGKVSSRALLICSVFHSLPIQVLRNDIRLIASGNGCNEDLQLTHLPADNIDIRVGDMLVSSGIDGRFPEGYPVAVVSYIKTDEQSDYITIKAHPIANLLYSKYLLLWGTYNNNKIPLLPDKVHEIANERLILKKNQNLQLTDKINTR